MNTLPAFLALALILPLPPSLAFAAPDAGVAAEGVVPPSPAAPEATMPSLNGLGSDLPPDVLARLTPAQIVQVLTERERTKRAMRAESDPPAVAIVVPVAVFVMIAVIVALILRFRSQRDERLQQTMHRMIDKGVEIPPALILPPEKKHGDLRKGLVLAFAGIAIANAFYSLGPNGSWSLGLIPLFAGLGYLAVWRIARTRQES